MPHYRQLNEAEVEDLASRIVFEAQFDLPHIRRGILRLFGPTAHEALIDWSNEYNDEGYDLRANSVTVWDAAGKELEAADKDAVADFRYDIRVHGVSESDEGNELRVFMNGTSPFPALYVLEP